MPGELIEDDRESATYDVDKGEKHFSSCYIVINLLLLNNETVFCQMSLGGQHYLIYAIRAELFKAGLR